MITNDRNATRRAKTVHINVRMTEAQRREVERRADDAGMAPSSYMRETAILAGEKPVRVADTDELRRIHVDLKRIGSNLNQAVRALNAYGADRTPRRPGLPDGRPGRVDGIPARRPPREGKGIGSC